jgi:hypothetical protein
VLAYTLDKNPKLKIKINKPATKSKQKINLKYLSTITNLPKLTKETAPIAIAITGNKIIYLKGTIFSNKKITLPILKFTKEYFIAKESSKRTELIEKINTLNAVKA